MPIYKFIYCLPTYKALLISYIKCIKIYKGRNVGLVYYTLYLFTL